MVAVNAFYKDDENALTFGIHFTHYHPITLINMHQDGSPGYTDDIAILELNNDMPGRDGWTDGMRPVCLPNKRIRSDDECRMAGWGG